VSAVSAVTDSTGYLVPFQRRGSILGEAAVNAVAEVVRSTEPLSSGRHRELFERRFAERTGARHALSTTSGTVALELAIRLLDLEPGDEVIVATQTFHATAAPLLELDVRVRFCDVDRDTLNIDPDRLAELITERTRAVLLVHYGGLPAEMDRVMDLARQHDLVVVEDSAHALGATYHGRSPGTLGHIGCFSFHSTKNITTLGEGGMITMDRPEWAQRVDRMRGNDVDGLFADPAQPTGAVPGVLPWMKFADQVYRRTVLELRSAGTNATMSEAAAAVGTTQLAALGAMTARRQAIAARLDAVLAEFPGVRLQSTPAHSTHAHHLYTAFLDDGPEAREQVIRTLDALGVEVQLRYFPLHLLPEWRARGHRPGECPVAEQAWFGSQISLPCHPALTDEQVDHLTAAVATALRRVHARRPLGVS
jgi:perosamine synthetase